MLAGYPVVGLKATLLDGSYHPVDSSEMAFIMAAKLAYKAAMPEAGPVILEPIHTLKAVKRRFQDRICHQAAAERRIADDGGADPSARIRHAGGQRPHTAPAVQGAGS